MIIAQVFPKGRRRTASVLGVEVLFLPFGSQTLSLSTLELRPFLRRGSGHVQGRQKGQVLELINSSGSLIGKRPYRRSQCY